MEQAPGNELDKLIREAGEKYRPGGANPDWDQMQSLLDKHMPAKKDNRRRLLFALFLLLLLGGSAYFYFGRPDKTSGIMPPTEQAVNTQQPATPNKLKQVNDDETGKSDAAKTVPLTQLSTKDATANSNVSTPSERQPGVTIKKGKANTSIQAASFGENSETASNEIGSVQDQIEKNTPSDPMVKITTDTIKVSADPTAIVKQAISTDSTVTAKKVAEPIPVVNKTKSPVKKAASRHWEFSLLYAPELTTIGFSKLDKPGSNFGLLVGYPVSKQLILQTGIIRSRKNYAARGEDFVLDYTLPASHTLTKVSGYCMMYELPLNIKSYIPTRKKVNIFYTAGISSYFMDSEFYTYQIKTPAGSYDKDASYHKQRNYWFSVAALSVGLEKELSPHFNLAVAPFAKIPFKGMGEGRLKMLGTGINFSLTYKPATSKN